MKKNAQFIIYTRCSTEEQAKGFSHSYQLSGIQNHHSIKDWVCLGQYSDTVSGMRFDNRKQLDQVYLIYEQLRGQLDYILVYRFDRLGRDVGDAFNTIKKFAAIGVEINCLDKWINYADPTWPIQLGIEFGLAQTESLKISERTKDGIYQANSEGYFTGSPPPGYQRIYTQKTRGNGKRVQLLVPDENAPIVKKVFEAFVYGMETRSELYLQYGAVLGVKRTQFYRIFSKVVYAGYIQLRAYKKNPPRLVKGKHEAIISKTLFDEAQKKIEKDQLKNPRRFSIRQEEFQNYYYLKGILFCANTGKPMTAFETKKRSGKLYHFYQTSRSKGGQLIKVMEAHQTVNQAISELQINEELYEATKTALLELIKEKNEADAKTAKKLIQEIQLLEGRIQTIQNHYADGELTSTEYRELKTKFETERKEKDLIYRDLVKKKDSEARFRLQVLQTFTSIQDVFRLAKFKHKKAILKAIFPEGIAIQDGYVKTRRINSYIAAMHSKPEDYSFIKIEKGLPFFESPVSGGRRELIFLNRTG